MDTRKSATFPFSSGNILFGKFGPNIQNCLFQVKFGTQINSNMQNSVVVFTFSGFDRKYPFWLNLVPIFTTICFSWNLVPRLIRICRTQWWYSIFSVLDRKYPFWLNFVQKIKIVCLSWNLVSRLSRACKIQWWCSLFLFQTENTPFRQILSKKPKLSV